MTTMVMGKVTQGALGSYPAYGMAMRFAVRVDDLSLGHWHSCKGLKVTLDYETVKQGGDYLEAVRLPDRLNYDAITLERAVLSAESKAVQSWLANYVRGWTIYPRTERGPNTTKATITLLDYQLSEVMTWELNGVFPKSWSGPSLGANDNKIAMETLVLEHSGFLVA